MSRYGVGNRDCGAMQCPQCPHQLRVRVPWLSAAVMHGKVIHYITAIRYRDRQLSNLQLRPGDLGLLTMAIEWASSQTQLEVESSDGTYSKLVPCKPGELYDSMTVRRYTLGSQKEIGTSVPVNVRSLQQPVRKYLNTPSVSVLSHYSSIIG